MGRHHSGVIAAGLCLLLTWRGCGYQTALSLSLFITDFILHLREFPQHPKQSLGWFSVCVILIRQTYFNDKTKTICSSSPEVLRQDRDLQLLIFLSCSVAGCQRCTLPVKASTLRSDISVRPDASLLLLSDWYHQQCSFCFCSWPLKMSLITSTQTHSSEQRAGSGDNKSRLKQWR